MASMPDVAVLTEQDMLGDSVCPPEGGARAPRFPAELAALTPEISSFTLSMELPATRG